MTPIILIDTNPLAIIFMYVMACIGIEIGNTGSIALA